MGEDVYNWAPDDEDMAALIEAMGMSVEEFEKMVQQQLSGGEPIQISWGANLDEALQGLQLEDAADVEEEDDPELN